MGRQLGVVVEIEQEAHPRGFGAGIARPTQALARLQHIDERRVFGGDGLHVVGCPVGRVVVDDHDFERAGRWQLGLNAVDHFREQRLAIVGADQQRDARFVARNTLGRPRGPFNVQLFA
jgi:hypothetical protein